MELISKLIGITAILAASFMARIFIFNKIYNITVARLGAPHLTFVQMLALSWFIGAVSTRPNKADLENGTMEETLKLSLISLLGLLVSWGIANLVFSWLL